MKPKTTYGKNLVRFTFYLQQDAAALYEKIAKAECPELFPRWISKFSGKLILDQIRRRRGSVEG